jgi:epoxyqueuosine reductase QueG
VGQLGANGQLLSPHFGSRAGLMMISTDAPVVYDESRRLWHPKFCQGVRSACSAVRRPDENLVPWCREEQADLQALPSVMARYLGCGVCKIRRQKFGLQA